MGAKEDFIDAITPDQKTIHYIVPKQGLLKKNAKIKFIIRSLSAKDFFTDDMRNQIMKEIANGQKMEEAARVMADKLKNDLIANSNDAFSNLFIEKGVVYPKIVNHDEVLADELPYSLLNKHWEIKLFLIKEIAKISPIFEGIK